MIAKEVERNIELTCLSAGCRAIETTGWFATIAFPIDPAGGEDEHTAGGAIQKSGARSPHRTADDRSSFDEFCHSSQSGLGSIHSHIHHDLSSGSVCPWNVFTHQIHSIRNRIDVDRSQILPYGGVWNKVLVKLIG